MMKQEMDVESEIERVSKELKLTIVEYQWIESHIKEGQKVDPYYQKLNENVDEVATITREEVISGEVEPVVHILFPGTIIGVDINGEIVHNELKKVITRLLGEERMYKYLLNKYDWDEHIIEMICWEGDRMAIDNYKPIT